MSASVEPPYFIVDPENTKLVSGEISFIERSHRKLRNAGSCFVLTLFVGLGFWLTNKDYWTSELRVYSMIAIFTLLPLFATISNLYAARLHYRLAGGEFVDGQIIQSKFELESQGKGTYVLWLVVIYRFRTPNGNSLQRSMKIVSHDSWKSYRSWEARYALKHPGREEYKRLQAFAPPVNTLMKIRYVEDDLFEVM